MGIRRSLYHAILLSVALGICATSLVAQESAFAPTPQQVFTVTPLSNHDQQTAKNSIVHTLATLRSEQEATQHLRTFLQQRTYSAHPRVTEGAVHGTMTGLASLVRWTGYTAVAIANDGPGIALGEAFDQLEIVVANVDIIAADYEAAWRQADGEERAVIMAHATFFTVSQFALSSFASRAVNKINNIGGEVRVKLKRDAGGNVSIDEVQLPEPTAAQLKSIGNDGEIGLAEVNLVWDENFANLMKQPGPAGGMARRRPVVDVTSGSYDDYIQRLGNEGLPTYRPQSPSTVQTTTTAPPRSSPKTLMTPQQKPPSSPQAKLSTVTPATLPIAIIEPPTLPAPSPLPLASKDNQEYLHELLHAYEEHMHRHGMLPMDVFIYYWGRGQAVPANWRSDESSIVAWLVKFIQDYRRARLDRSLPANARLNRQQYLAKILSELAAYSIAELTEHLRMIAAQYHLPLDTLLETMHRLHKLWPSVNGTFPLTTLHNLHPIWPNLKETNPENIRALRHGLEIGLLPSGTESLIFAADNTNYHIDHFSPVDHRWIRGIIHGGRFAGNEILFECIWASQRLLRINLIHQGKTIELHADVDDIQISGTFLKHLGELELVGDDRETGAAIGGFQLMEEHLQLGDTAIKVDGAIVGNPNSLPQDIITRSGYGDEWHVTLTSGIVDKQHAKSRYHLEMANYLARQAARFAHRFLTRFLPWSAITKPDMPMITEMLNIALYATNAHVKGMALEVNIDDPCVSIVGIFPLPDGSKIFYALGTPYMAIVPAAHNSDVIYSSSDNLLEQLINDGSITRQEALREGARNPDAMLPDHFLGSITPSNNIAQIMRVRAKAGDTLFLFTPQLTYAPGIAALQSLSYGWPTALLSHLSSQPSLASLQETHSGSVDYSVVRLAFDSSVPIGPQQAATATAIDTSTNPDSTNPMAQVMAGFRVALQRHPYLSLHEYLYFELRNLPIPDDLDAYSLPPMQKTIEQWYAKLPNNVAEGRLPLLEILSPLALATPATVAQWISKTVYNGVPATDQAQALQEEAKLLAFVTFLRTLHPVITVNEIPLFDLGSYNSIFDPRNIWQSPMRNFDVVWALSQALQSHPAVLSFEVGSGDTSRRYHFRITGAAQRKNNWNSFPGALMAVDEGLRTIHGALQVQCPNRQTANIVFTPTEPLPVERYQTNPETMTVNGTLFRTNPPYAEPMFDDAVATLAPQHPSERSVTLPWRNKSLQVDMRMFRDGDDEAQNVLMLNSRSSNLAWQFSAAGLTRPATSLDLHSSRDFIPMQAALVMQRYLRYFFTPQRNLTEVIDDLVQLTHLHLNHLQFPTGKAQEAFIAGAFPHPSDGSLIVYTLGHEVVVVPHDKNMPLSYALAHNSELQAATLAVGGQRLRHSGLKVYRFFLHPGDAVFIAGTSSETEASQNLDAYFEALSFPARLRDLPTENTPFPWLIRFSLPVALESDVSSQHRPPSQSLMPLPIFEELR